MNMTQIPMQLRQLKQWVGVYPDNKIPYDVIHKQAASTSDPSTWCSFYEAEAFCPEVGFVFHDNGIVGIDIDAGWTDDGFLSDMALDCISVCQSYTEKSRSGRGFHILVKGDIPFKGKNNRNGIEIYKTGRYFIMTGDVVIYDAIKENQNALNYIVSRYFAPESVEKGYTDKIYNPVWERIQGHKIPLRPMYPMIETGSRNICLASLAGMLHTQGYSYEDLLRELLYCNNVACYPPLSYREVKGIADSIVRYKR